MSTKTLMTVEQFVQLDRAENQDFELVDGELIPLSSPVILHAIIRERLARLIGNYLEKNPRGGLVCETDCRIKHDTVRRPDVSIFLGERWQNLDVYSIPVPFAPDIAVEVLSPSEHIMDVNRKVRDYQSAGSKEVWLLDHAICEVHVRTRAGMRILEAGDLLESPLLPGLSVRVADLLSAQ